jgi:hypothetical protein
MAENIKVTEECKRYWAYILAVIDAAGDYSSVVKLYANLEDVTTAQAVQPVFVEYYDGKMSKLREAIVYRENQFYVKVNKLNILCKEHGLVQITKPKKLLELLLSSKRRKSYREKAKRRLKKGIICPLQDFEAKK